MRDALSIRLVPPALLLFVAPLAAGGCFNLDGLSTGIADGGSPPALDLAAPKGDGGGVTDLAAPAPDLSGVRDLSLPRDLTTPRDLVVPGDLAMRDLSVVRDLSVPPDLTALRDLAVPPDLVAPPGRNKVDVLFLVDNSGSMEGMQAELRARFPAFIRSLSDLTQQGLYLDLQVGVVTSDYGAGFAGAPGCGVSPGGQAGKLVRIGAAAGPNCAGPVGANFIKYAFKPGGQDVHNLPQGLSLSDTFGCMAAVGSTGCGFEHQLESVRAALVGNLQENAGFLRPDALLVVVFLTNEDDCSGPTNSDLYDRNSMQYGFMASYRCAHYGIVHGLFVQTLLPYGDSGGPVANPAPAPNPNGMGPGKLFDVSRYTDLFTRPALLGGVKVDPRDVILYTIAPPAAPVQVILSNPGTPAGQPYVQCGQINEAANPPCSPVVQHACMNLQRPTFFGDPAVRLNAVVQAVANRGSTSICDDDYTPAFLAITKLITNAL